MEKVLPIIKTVFLPLIFVIDLIVYWKKSKAEKKKKIYVIIASVILVTLIYVVIYFIEKTRKIKYTMLVAPIVVTLMKIKSYAAGSISTTEVQVATENVKNAIVKLAMPIGTILMFVSIVIIALKMIANSGNPNKRTDSLSGRIIKIKPGLSLGINLFDIETETDANGYEKVDITGKVAYKYKKLDIK